MSLRPLFIIAAAIAVTGAGFAAEQPIALYTFEGANGERVRDRSGIGQPLDLMISNPAAVRRSKGELEITGHTIIRSLKPAAKIIEAAKRGKALSLEVWMRPADTKQAGPARVVTISKNSTERNLTLGQDGDKVDVRTRTTATSANGLPSLAGRSGSLAKVWTHCVYTMRAGRSARIYVGGELVANSKAGGDVSNWDGGMQLALGNEHSGERQWLGALRRVAVYDRELAPDEVRVLSRAPGFETVAKATPAPAPRALPVDVVADGGQRVGGSLLALYDFAGAEGDTIRDRSGQEPPLDLKIANTNAVRRTKGELEIRGPAGIASEQAAGRISEAVRRSGALTVEAWVRPAKGSQDGPARVVTLSDNTSARNFTLGQDGDHWDFRLRTTKTNTNGSPSLAGKGKALTRQWSHVVYTRERNGRTRFYLNGKADASGQALGGLTNWESGFRLALGDEFGKQRRAWLGSYRLVAVYGRALSGQDVAGNYKAGPDAKTRMGEHLADASGHPNAQRFHDGVAPLLAKHCLECHDTANQKGDLDLSKRSAALASKVIVPGKAGESEFYTSVLEGDMPHKRDPLAAVEKELLKRWIDAGAHWPIEEIDPLAHKRDRRAAQNWVRRLTVPEYIATVEATVGCDISKEALQLLPRDLRADGFSNTAYNLGVDLKHVEAYSRLAEIIVSRIEPGKFASRFSSNRKFTDKGMEDLLRKMGRWVLRGPLEDHEVNAYRGISTAVASAGGSFDEAVGLMLEAMLQSPRFIYQIETQTGGGQVWLDDHQLAARMSYILWGASPDGELARAADKGELADASKARAQIGRMLKDPRAIAQSAQFASDWLHLDRLENLAPNSEKFLGWRPELAGDMRAETLAFFEEIVWARKRPLGELLNAQVTFITPRLAEHYRLGERIEGGSGELVKVSLEETPSRGGLLTHGSVLTIGGDSASMVTRGLFVLHDLLRSGVNDPPPGTDTNPVPSKPGLPQRRIAEQRVNDKACGGCHSKFEPLAYGLERFDGLGTYSETDRYGNALRHDGAILFPGEAKPTPYKTSAELMDLLAGSDRVRETITWKLAQFALGRPLTSADSKQIKAIHQAAQKNGGTYQAIVTELVLSELVQTTKTSE